MASLSILLWSPGCPHRSRGDLGLPHLVALGSFLQHHARASVTVVDEDYEAMIGGSAYEELPWGDWDIVGLSCYTSFDFQSVFARARHLRDVLPGTTLVVGGYHPSARPGDFLGDNSPFDYVVVGEGELPLLRIARAVAACQTLDDWVLGPEILPDLDDLPTLDWSLLERYRPLFMDGPVQFNLGLSRGCPFRCAFCMEHSKRSSRWRAYSPRRAFEEIERLCAAFANPQATLRITDAIFGSNSDWRRDVLARFGRQPPPVRKIWACTRFEDLERSDLQAFHRANFGLGFGLESGSPEMLRIMDKTTRPKRFLEHFRHVAIEAGAVGLPWGANMIAGHPGETPRTLAKSAAWLEEMVQSVPRLTGFVAVDPYRFYPGSRVEAALPEYRRRYGTRVHHQQWWSSSEPTADSARVDASSNLGFARRDQLRRELFEPIMTELLRRFAYNGPVSDYFLRAMMGELEGMRHKPTQRHRQRGVESEIRFASPPPGHGAADALRLTPPVHFSVWTCLVFHVLGYFHRGGAGGACSANPAYARWANDANGMFDDKGVRDGLAQLARLCEKNNAAFLLDAVPGVWHSLGELRARRTPVEPIGARAELVTAIRERLPARMLAVLERVLGRLMDLGYEQWWEEAMLQPARRYAGQFSRLIAEMDRYVPGLLGCTWHLVHPLCLQGRALPGNDGGPAIFVGVADAALGVPALWPALQGVHEFLVTTLAPKDYSPRRVELQPGTEGYSLFADAELAALSRGTQLLVQSPWAEAHRQWRATLRLAL